MIIDNLYDCTILMIDIDVEDPQKSQKMRNIRNCYFFWILLGCSRIVRIKYTILKVVKTLTSASFQTGLLMYI